MIEILKPDFKFGDDRGMLVQLIHEGFKQINVITSQTGAVRGGHYHTINREAFFVIQGALKLKVKKGCQAETYEFKSGDMFLIPSLIWHEFYFLDSTQLVSMYDIGVEVDGQAKDIYNFKIVSEMTSALIAKGCTPTNSDFIAWRLCVITCLSVIFGEESPEYHKFVSRKFEPDRMRQGDAFQEKLQNYCIGQLDECLREFKVYI